MSRVIVRRDYSQFAAPLPTPKAPPPLEYHKLDPRVHAVQKALLYLEELFNTREPIDAFHDEFCRAVNRDPDTWPDWIHQFQFQRNQVILRQAKGKSKSRFSHLSDEDAFTEAVLVMRALAVHRGRRKISRWKEFCDACRVLGENPSTWRRWLHLYRKESPNGSRGRGSRSSRRRKAMKERKKAATAEQATQDQHLRSITNEA